MRTRLALIFLAAALSAACNDTTGFTDWDATPDSALLYSASRADLLGQPSALDFTTYAVMRVENPAAAGAWDFALTGTSQLQLVPASQFGSQQSKAAIIQITGKTFAEVMEAPSDTSLYKYNPVTLAVGNIYVVRTRRVACSYTNAVHYAKIQVAALDPVAGTAKFAVVRNPYCDDRSFDPKK